VCRSVAVLFCWCADGQYVVVIKREGILKRLSFSTRRAPLNIHIGARKGIQKFNDNSNVVLRPAVNAVLPLRDDNVRPSLDGGKAALNIDLLGWRGDYPKPVVHLMTGAPNPDESVVVRLRCEDDVLVKERASVMEAQPDISAKSEL